MDGDDKVAASGAAAGSAGAVETSAARCTSATLCAVPWTAAPERLDRPGGSNCDRRRSRSTPLEATVAERPAAAPR